MMNSEDALNALVEGALHSYELLYRTGFHVPIPWIPEYVELRDWYYSKPRWLRWLFFRKRRQLDELRKQQQQAYLEAVLREGADLE